MKKLSGMLMLSLVTTGAVTAIDRPAVAQPARVRHEAIATADPISGDWDVTFVVQNMNVPGTMSFKLEGEVVSGSCYTEHTGPGTIRNGSWAGGKLAFTADFAKHESIAVTGALKDGKLVGEFRTEGMTGAWEASRK